MTATKALAFVKQHGVVLESARGPAPNLAEHIAGERIRGSWWGHRRALQIFRCSRAIRDSKDVVVCRLLGGKVTYLHRRLWPAVVRLRRHFDPKGLCAIRDIHTSRGRHETIVVAFPKWVPSHVMAKAAKLTFEEAAEEWPLKLRAKRQH